jgi:hypothetical protein
MFGVDLSHGEEAVEGVKARRTRLKRSAVAPFDETRVVQTRANQSTALSRGDDSALVFSVTIKVTMATHDGDGYFLLGNSVHTTAVPPATPPSYPNCGASELPYPAFWPLSHSLLLIVAAMNPLQLFATLLGSLAVLCLFQRRSSVRAVRLGIDPGIFNLKI